VKTRFPGGAGTVTGSRFPGDRATMTGYGFPGAARTGPAVCHPEDGVIEDPESELDRCAVGAFQLEEVHCASSHMAGCGDAHRVVVIGEAARFHVPRAAVAGTGDPSVLR
jgi:hypothetical protein